MSESKTDEEKTQETHDILARAMSYCWSEDFLGAFRKYFTEYAYVFEEHAEKHMAVSKTEHVMTPTVEHDLEHHACFQKYLKLFEDTLQDFVDSENSTNKDFYIAIADCKEKDNITPEENLFIDCLLASADYDSFYSVMIKEAKKNIIMRNAGKQMENMDIASGDGGGGAAAESKDDGAEDEKSDDK
ncbi:hypothetical protein ScalyP_jg968 [Parmales sp. scaly parma]|nr:hypothetical protein ScalyP_jg968 [Parmales sp. scaly parma]